MQWKIGMSLLESANSLDPFSASLIDLAIGNLRAVSSNLGLVGTEGLVKRPRNEPFGHRFLGWQGTHTLQFGLKLLEPFPHQRLVLLDGLAIDAKIAGGEFERWIHLTVMFDALLVFDHGTGVVCRRRWHLNGRNTA